MKTARGGGRVTWDFLFDCVAVCDCGYALCGRTRLRLPSEVESVEASVIHKQSHTLFIQKNTVTGEALCSLEQNQSNVASHFNAKGYLLAI